MKQQLLRYVGAAVALIAMGTSQANDTLSIYPVQGTIWHSPDNTLWQMDLINGLGERGRLKVNALTGAYDLEWGGVTETGITERGTAAVEVYAAPQPFASIRQSPTLRIGEHSDGVGAKRTAIWPLVPVVVGACVVAAMQKQRELSKRADSCSRSGGRFVGGSTGICGQGGDDGQCLPNK